MKNMNQIFKQAQQMQQKMQEIQEKSESITQEGSAGGGMVVATVNGKGQLLRLKIDPSIVNTDDVEMLEDLIIASFNDAKNKAEESINKEMSSITGGLNIPGLKLPF
ncbi:MAG: YbaB/EbfC family nucleoid-associated protein [Pseudomonadota bacterium]|jgi:DNA-binding YbaB/EbfC family protein|nr:YbaB/EbfC family nucleoid-associated protein [Alphaproteobacteria bacterium]